MLWWLSHSHQSTDHEKSVLFSVHDAGGMPVHDAVGINCKKGATTENQGSAVKYMGQGVYRDDCVCVFYLT